MSKVEFNIGGISGGVLQMAFGVPLDGTLRAVQDKDGNNSALFLSTNSITGRGTLGILTDTIFGETPWSFPGGKNTVFGYNQGLTIDNLGAGGSENVVFGSSNFYGTNTIGNRNIAIGVAVMQENGNINNSIAIGSNALSYTFNYDSAIAIGNGAMGNLNDVVLSSYDIAIGNYSGLGVRGGKNIGIGAYTLRWYDFGVTHIGSASQRFDTMDSHSTYVGFSGDMPYGALGRNVFIGSQFLGLPDLASRVGIGVSTAGYGVAIGVNTGASYYGIGTAVGVRALESCANNYLFAFGHFAFSQGTSLQSNNFAFGTPYSEMGVGMALSNASNATGNTFFGNVVAINPTSSTTRRSMTNCTYFGMAIAFPPTSSSSAHSNNTVLGNGLSRVTTGSGSTIVGIGTALNLTSAANLTAIGHYAGQNITTGGNNTIIGTEGGNGINTGLSNVFIGNTLNMFSGSGGSNVCIGTDIQCGGTANTNIGYGINAIAGGASIILGATASVSAANQFSVGSASINAGTLNTESVTSNATWTVRINGTQYKILLQV